ncbi:MAG: F0F1 ATP synthase subunit alpha [Candidatus Omnitrophota bacterium]
MADLRYTEIGRVRCIRGCIVVVTGFKHCISGQLIKFGYGTEGTIIGFDETEAQVLIVKETEKIKTGDKAVASLEPFLVPVGDKLLGRIVNPLGESLDGLGPLEHDKMAPIFINAPPILARVPLCKTLETGIKVLDTMIPIGYGQRELILGDKMTGKTTIITDTILNQKGKNVVCIYCCIGKSRSSLAKVVQLFQDHECFRYTIIVSATASCPPGQQYLAPYVACSIGEHFMNQGKDVIVGFDDFTKHAWCYREISLLLGRPPGRDSYPGDIFYLHSKMIERAAFLDQDHGGGSMTFLPIVEILEGDLTGYISSNLISMTDGQIMLSTPLFGEGQKPAVDIGLSVSRVGSKVQWPVIKKFTGSLRLDYIQFRELLRVSKLKSSGQSEEAQQQMKTGEILTEIIKQDKDSPVSLEALAFVLYAYTKKLLLQLTIDEVKAFQNEIAPFCQKKNPDLLKILRERKKIDDEITKGFESVIKDYIKEAEAKRPKDEEEEAEEVGVGEDALDKATTAKGS